MTAESFYRTEPSEGAAWRLAILMGANTRTYKFALGSALLACAERGEDAAALRDVAAAYAMGVVGRPADARQASAGTADGDADFLAVAGREREESRRLGRPTEELVDAAVRTMPGMVMRKFHNLRGSTEVPHRFYELTGRGTGRVVRFTPQLRRLVRNGQVSVLRAELEARWSIVESSFSAEVGRSLMADGVRVDWDTLTLTDRRRRRSVAGVGDALTGFQHGRCLICGDVIAPEDGMAVDHVFPYALMRRFGGVSAWAGPDLDVIWNLAPAHPRCNAAKSARLPTAAELAGLARRNEAIMDSPHPLKQTLKLTLTGAGVRGWPEFLRAVQAVCC
ncbi:HNH endonuclease [Streptomyces huiliensis]|uniref:HNH endonuclease n=1 Tax=Streptomyces huiliensis TaxID=2876027 RepID=UPI001CC1A1D8|nr:HNH endonuclease domain-containing protein [Streptomyces huiliensis]MBZ4320009.1 HNH endonuclease [Streptomyces huiliensis]